MATTPVLDADNDNYSYKENSLASNIVFLDVMKNDSGGASKYIFSIDDGTGTQKQFLSDLSTRDLAGTHNVTAAGNQMWITADGQVAVDLSQSIFKLTGS